MPRPRQKARKHRSSENTTADVTVYDYANAEKPPSGSCRLKKGTKLTSQAQVKMMAVGGREADSELSWFEKELDEFEISPSGDNSASDGEDNPSTSFAEKIKEKAGRVSVQGAGYDSDEGRDFPLDIWYLLSCYIAPEDIPTFSCLCRSANSVVRSALFWRNVYHRYYKKNVSELPELLKPSSIERAHGLRARVIRALHYLYEPFVESCRSSQVFTDEPHRLEGLRCVMCWYQKVKQNVWRFNFKLRHPRVEHGLKTGAHSGSVDLMHGYNDVYDNSEEGCCVLQVTCHNFIQNPMVMGLVLTKVYLSVSQGMRHHRLKLNFDSQMRTVKNGTVSGTQIVLDPVLNLRVFYWWEPLYTTNC